MKKIIFFSLLAFLFLGGCSKSDDLAVNPIENQLKSVQSSISKDKQEREILFISKIDGVDDEIYAMNEDGS